MKVLVIGNSHVAAIKKAYSNIEGFGISCSFIARPAGGLGINTLYLRDGNILNSDKDGKGFSAWTNESVDSFNAFMFVGRVLPRMPPNRYSKALIEAWKEDLIKDRTDFNLGSKIAKRTQEKVIYMDKPFFSDYETSNSYSDHVKNIRLLNRLMNNPLLKFLPNPEPAIADNLQKTKSEYALSDGRHMNKDYGLLVLNELQKELENNTN
jgi:hypothetical protein